MHEFETFKLGFNNTYGNKGYILSRFKINDTYFGICSAHLHGKKNENDKRLEELKLILNSKIKGKNETKFNENDVFFILGDLNFKVRSEREVVNKIIQDKDFSQLEEIDEFLYERAKNSEISKEISEGKIQYDPTYQFINKSNEYSNKKVPSWYISLLIQV